MKSHTEYLVFETKKRREMVHITDRVEEIVRRSGVKDGLCFVSPMHITAAIYVNDLESGLIEDIGKWLEELAPARPEYKHHQTGEDNADAHLKSLLLHHETTLPVTNGPGSGNMATRLLRGVRWAEKKARDCESAGSGVIRNAHGVSVKSVLVMYSSPSIFRTILAVFFPAYFASSGDHCTGT